MHRLLLYPDHPFDIGEIWGKRFNPQTKHYEPFLVTEAPDLPKDCCVFQGAQADRGHP